MTTLNGAYQTLKDRLLEAPAIQDENGADLPVRYQADDGGPLPDTATSFAFLDFDNHGAGRYPVAYGGGRGSNLYRNEGVLTVFVFTPNGTGMAVAATVAESVAARMRSFRSGDVSCFAASVRPTGEGSDVSPRGFNSPVSNYYCTPVEVAMHFDQIG